jgi:hypothetical protein
MATIAREQRDLLPHSIEAERAVVGAILIDPDAILRAREVDLAAEDFYSQAAREIYAAVMELSGRYAAVDFITVVTCWSSQQRSRTGEQFCPLSVGAAELARTSQIPPQHLLNSHARSSTHRQHVGDWCRRRDCGASQLHEGPIELAIRGLGLEIFSAIDVTPKIATSTARRCAVSTRDVVAVTQRDAGTQP